MRIFLLSSVIFFYLPLYSQKVVGTVSNEKGEPLPFASIVVKGTSRGASANEKAKFSLSLPSGGKYTLICQYIGYAAAEKTVDVQGETQVSFTLKENSLTLGEVVIDNNREDPAYEIIRNAIAKRKYYRNQVKGFRCEAYAKDKITLRSLPKKIFGQKIETEDKKDMGLDSAGKGILYLSESLSEVYFKEPDMLKTEVKSSRVSGSNSFGFTFPVFITLYENNVRIFEQISGSRGYVSPIAEGAIGFYKYKFLGTFWEGDRSVNAIRVTPRRSYEPLFSGIINITEDDWRIHSFDLYLTKKSQLELLDTLRITQLHVPVSEDVWRVKNQLIDFSFKMLGIAAGGKFLSVYSDYEVNPEFKKGFFDRVVIKYDTAVSSRKKEYWDTVRPVVLEPEEQLDYRIKDSAFLVRQTEEEKINVDSLRKKQGPVKPFAALRFGLDRTHYGKHSRYKWGFNSITAGLNFNNAEGVNKTFTGYFEKWLKKSKSMLTVIPNIRYGFENGHLNPSLSAEWDARGLNAKKMLRRWSVVAAGGKRVSQFNAENPITETINTFSTLLYGYNFMKTYENYFATAGWRKTTENGIRLNAGVLWEDRTPLDNINKYTFRKGDTIHITPNYPVEKLSSQFKPHQALIFNFSISMQPGQRYIQFPNTRLPIGSKFPTFTFKYSKGINGILGSDVDFDKWQFTISDDRNLGIPGLIKYKLGAGGFLNSRKLFIQDFQHFNGNRTWIATPYVSSFQVADYYQNSTDTRFYMIGHLEHHFNGLLTNKIPGFRKLKWNLVGGVNSFYVNRDNHYSDVFVGLENIFKIFRIDWVASLYNNRWQPAVVRLGAGGLLGGSMNLNESGKSGGRSISVNF